MSNTRPKVQNWPGKDSNPSHWINFGKCKWLHTFLTFNSIFIRFTALLLFFLKEKKAPPWPFHYHVKKLTHAVEGALLYLILRYLVWPKVRSKWPVCDYDVKRIWHLRSKWYQTKKETQRNNCDSAIVFIIKIKFLHRATWWWLESFK